MTIQAENDLRENKAIPINVLSDEIYEKLGVHPIDRLGEKFDPNLENAVLQGSAEEGEPGTVCQVLQKGYEMNGTVLRHAMVKVVAE